jgi:hypothetical protein
MSFGKRQAGVGAAAQTVNAGTAVSYSQAITEAPGPTGHPIRWLLLLLAIGGAIYGLFVSYGPNILRDNRLAGTWQPAYDLRAVEGKCERKNFIVTFCNTKIASVARPDQAPIAVSFMMLFSGGGGEAMVPVRTTTDRAAVSIFYAAEAKLLNRTLSFIFSAAILALIEIIALLMFWKAANSFSD